MGHAILITSRSHRRSNLATRQSHLTQSTSHSAHPPVQQPHDWLWHHLPRYIPLQNNQGTLLPRPIQMDLRSARPGRGQQLAAGQIRLEQGDDRRHRRE